MRTPDFTRTIQAKSLRARGLSFRKIAKKMQSDTKTVFRWVGYDLSKYEKFQSAVGGKN